MTNKKKKNRREYTRYVGQFKMVEHIIETLKGENLIGAEKKKNEFIMAKNFLKLKRYQIIVLESSENIKQNNAHRYVYLQGFPGSSGIKNPPVMQEMGFSSWVGKIPLRRKWQPTPVFLPGKSHGQRSLAGYCPWDSKSQT